MYEIFLLSVERTVSLQLAGLRQSPGKTFSGSWKVLEFFRKRESGNPVMSKIQKTSEQNSNARRVN